MAFASRFGTRRAARSLVGPGPKGRFLAGSRPDPVEWTGGRPHSARDRGALRTWTLAQSRDHHPGDRGAAGERSARRGAHAGARDPPERTHRAPDRSAILAGHVAEPGARRRGPEPDDPAARGQSGIV